MLINPKYLSLQNKEQHGNILENIFVLNKQMKHSYHHLKQAASSGPPSCCLAPLNNW
jgi:hypothetical protein